MVGDIVEVITLEQQLIFTCVVCGSELIEKEDLCTCTFCGKQEVGEWLCPKGHYNCEECRLASAEEVIKRVCLHTPNDDPWEIANLIMKHPVFSHHGMEHHLLVAPVLLTAIANKTKDPINSRTLENVIKRTNDIPQGVCGSRGDCGASVGAGAAVSTLLKANYNSGFERSLVITTVSRALLRIAEMGGHRCCKQSVYAALEIGVKVLADQFNLDLEPMHHLCIFSNSIVDCKKDACPYY